ncbi:MAG: metallophosphoesterase [Parvularculaceae bacterium]|nr:metallophosphoesterase [Parvularculaceae bacterium]
MVDFGILEKIKLGVYYASYLYFPAAIILGWLILRGGSATKILSVLALAFLSVLAYARFVEPRILLTMEHEARLARCFPEAGSARLAVFSDMHEGLFKNAVSIRRIADKVNLAEPDAAFIAGDFVYFLDPARQGEAFSALASIRAPVFAVLGNHDVGLPGPDVSASLEATLARFNVVMLDDKITTARLNGAEVEIVGLSELWAKNQDRSLLEARRAKPRLVLAHNPSTILELKPRESVDLLLAGHTHGAQINIPGLNCMLLKSMCRVTLYGFAQMERGLVFVTSGTGMVGLPMRFNRAPRIDVIDLEWRACA